MRTDTATLRAVTGSFTRTAALVIALSAGLALAAFALRADPIGDGSLVGHRTGWFSNVSRSGPLTCAETCRTKAAGSAPEHEASAVPPTKRTFVCRVPGRPSGDLKTWLYGNQFDDRPACYTTGLDLKGSYQQRYFCLCVAR